jgi:hypothetical protein
VLSVLAIALVASAPEAAIAQSFSFGISSGHGHHHGHHHHRHHWHDHCYAPWFGIAIAPPPPVYRERVIYVEPPRTSTIIVPSGTQLSTTAAPANTIASTPVAGASDARITIRNGSGTKLPVSFLVDGQDVELPDGEIRTFAGLDRRSVQYDRGGRFGSTQQDLTAGDYEFRITASGWDLVRRPSVPDRTAVRPNALPPR